MLIFDCDWLSVCLFLLKLIHAHVGVLLQLFNIYNNYPI